MKRNLCTIITIFCVFLLYRKLCIVNYRLQWHNITEIHGTNTPKYLVIYGLLNIPVYTVQ